MKMGDFAGEEIVPLCSNGDGGDGRGPPQVTHRQVFRKKVKGMEYGFFLPRR